MCISVSMDLLCMILTVNHRISSNVLKLQIPYTVHVQGKDYFQECLDVHVPYSNSLPILELLCFRSCSGHLHCPAKKKLTELLVN